MSNGQDTETGDVSRWSYSTQESRDDRQGSTRSSTCSGIADDAMVGMIRKPSELADTLSSGEKGQEKGRKSDKSDANNETKQAEAKEGSGEQNSTDAPKDANKK